MARPQKEGLDYFSMDVEKDNKIKFLKAKFGVLGFGLYIEFLQFIYKQGYYTIRDEDNVLLFMTETGLKDTEIELMLAFMLDKGLFNVDLYKKHSILTSSGIQKRYAEGTKRRSKLVIDSQYWLVGDYDHIELMYTETELMSTKAELMLEESTQSKEKEKKGKETEVQKQIIDGYSFSQELRKYIDEFVEHRKEIKSPMAQRALVTFLNEIKPLTDQVAINSINKAMINGRKSIYPEKQDTKMPETRKNLTQAQIDALYK